MPTYPVHSSSHFDTGEEILPQLLTTSTSITLPEQQVSQKLPALLQQPARWHVHVSSAVYESLKIIGITHLFASITVSNPGAELDSMKRSKPGF